MAVRRWMRTREGALEAYKDGVRGVSIGLRCSTEKLEKIEGVVEDRESNSGFDWMH